MEQQRPDIHLRPKVHPLIASLPERLKDPANYKKIQKALLDVGATRHSHSEMLDWAGCKPCQTKQWARKELMQQLGFKSGAQYYAWCRVHEEIKRRMPLGKFYNK